MSLQRETLGSQLYRLLRHRILEGELPSGRHISQSELAAEMGVSRIPVRDALRKLETDGLLISDETGRQVVAGFNEADLHEVYAIRQSLEPLALDLAFVSLRDKCMSALEALVQKMEEAAKAMHVDDYVELDIQFHHTICDECGNERLKKIIRSLRLGLPQMMPIKIPERLAQSSAEHRQIFERIKSGDKTGAKRAMEAHVASASRVLSEKLKSHTGAGALHRLSTKVAE